ncbi:MAG: hypothetical protein KAT17_05860, partial [Candidatus Aminicenantes bacterium]|nr:hypothetical protein [Candidatus Aminicenantes bacterium]
KKKVMDEYNQFVENKLKELEEENKKIAAENEGKQKGKQRPLKTWEKPPAPEIPVLSSFHNLYLRVVKEGNIIQRFKSPVPFDEKETEYYSFGLILEPGKYDILVNIDRYDNSSDGTLLIELDVPKLTLMDLVSPLGQLEYSRPIFYREMMKSRIVEKRFTVLKNKYQVGQQLFFPIIGKEIQFKANESPTLTFFIKGAAKVENNQPQWNVSTQMEIRQGKKKILIFKVPSLNTPYFFQKLEFKKGNNFLPAGDYLLFVGLSDNNQAGKKAKIEIPFKLIE